MALLGVAAAPSPSPTPTTATGAADRLVDDVRAGLSFELATALAAQMQLSDVLRQNTEQQEAASRELAATAARLADLDASIRARQARMDATRARIDAERAQLAALARALARQPASLVERLALAGSLREALTGTADLEAAGGRGRELKAALIRQLAELRAEQDRQRAEREQQATIQARDLRTLDALRQLRTQEDQTSAALAAAVARTRTRLAATRDGALADRMSHELDAEQARIIAAAEQQAWSQVAIALSGRTGQSPVSAGHSTRTRLVWPLPQATVSQGFGPTELALEPAYAGHAHFHTGLDLAAPLGATVLAADDGVVAVVSSGTTGYGNFVVIAHTGGLTTLYGHLAVPLVVPGRQVAQGQPVGLEGSTGSSTGPHLHFEVRVGAQPVDPAPFLPAGGPSASRA